MEPMIVPGYAALLDVCSVSAPRLKRSLMDFHEAAAFAIPYARVCWCFNLLEGATAGFVAVLTHFNVPTTNGIRVSV